MLSGRGDETRGRDVPCGRGGERRGRGDETREIGAETCGRGDDRRYARLTTQLPPTRQLHRKISNSISVDASRSFLSSATDLTDSRMQHHQCKTRHCNSLLYGTTTKTSQASIGPKFTADRYRHKKI